MTSKTKIRIATRESRLAMWQAEFVKTELEKHHPGIIVELHGFTTQGDNILQTSLAKIGGKGLFVKELENALLQNEADIAVHSLKDVPAELPDGLCLPIICKREDPRDVLVSNKYSHVSEIPSGAVIGTSSLRRECLMKSMRPDLQFKTLRGNVQTRLSKLDDNEFDAIILAAAGLKRLDLAARISQYLDPNIFIPAVGQGALGIECRSDDVALLKLLQPLNDQQTHCRVTAERAMNRVLEGGCQVPIGVYATLSGENLLLQGMVGLPDGSLMVRGMVRGLATEAEQLGKRLANNLLEHGADKILKMVYKTKN